MQKLSQDSNNWRTISDTPWKAIHSGTGDASVISAPIPTKFEPFEVTIVKRCSWENAYLIEAAPKLLMMLEIEHENYIDTTEDNHCSVMCKTCLYIADLKKRTGIK